MVGHVSCAMKDHVHLFIGNLLVIGYDTATSRHHQRCIVKDSYKFRAEALI